MDAYVSQKAKDALRALSSEGPLRPKVLAARAHLSTVCNENFMAGMPSTLRQDMTKAMSGDINDDARNVASLLRNLISGINRESRKRYAEAA